MLKRKLLILLTVISLLLVTVGCTSQPVRVQTLKPVKPQIPAGLVAPPVESDFPKRLQRILSG